MLVALLRDPVMIQFFTVMLSAPSVPVVELDDRRIQAMPAVDEVAATILMFCVPAVNGSSPSMVTLSAPANSMIPLLVTADALELMVTLPLGFIVIAV
ncbi:hypothetical protein D9M68_737250 [compost metagenome]